MNPQSCQAFSEVPLARLPATSSLPHSHSRVLAELSTYCAPGLCGVRVARTTHGVPCGRHEGECTRSSSGGAAMACACAAWNVPATVPTYLTSCRPEKAGCLCPEIRRVLGRGEPVSPSHMGSGLLLPTQDHPAEAPHFSGQSWGWGQQRLHSPASASPPLAHGPAASQPPGTCTPVPPAHLHPGVSSPQPPSQVFPGPAPSPFRSQLKCHLLRVAFPDANHPPPHGPALVFVL